MAFYHQRAAFNHGKRPFLAILSNFKGFQTPSEPLSHHFQSFSNSLSPTRVFEYVAMFRNREMDDRTHNEIKQDLTGYFNAADINKFAEEMSKERDIIIYAKHKQKSSILQCLVGSDLLSVTACNGLAYKILPGQKEIHDLAIHPCGSFLLKELMTFVKSEGFQQDVFDEVCGNFSRLITHKVGTFSCQAVIENAKYRVFAQKCREKGLKQLKKVKMIKIGLFRPKMT